MNTRGLITAFSLAGDVRRDRRDRLPNWIRHQFNLLNLKYYSPIKGERGLPPEVFGFSKLLIRWSGSQDSNP